MRAAPEFVSQCHASLAFLCGAESVLERIAGRFGCRASAVGLIRLSALRPARGATLEVQILVWPRAEKLTFRIESPPAAGGCKKIECGVDEQICRSIAAHTVWKVRQPRRALWRGLAILDLSGQDTNHEFGELVCVARALLVLRSVSTHHLIGTNAQTKLRPRI